MEYVRRCNNEIREYRDCETGVHYFVTSGHAYESGVNICPRYNADGTLYVTCKNIPAGRQRRRSE